MHGSGRGCTTPPSKRCWHCRAAAPARQRQAGVGCPPAMYVLIRTLQTCTAVSFFSTQRMTAALKQRIHQACTHCNAGCRARFGQFCLVRYPLGNQSAWQPLWASQLPFTFSRPLSWWTDTAAAPWMQGVPVPLSVLLWWRLGSVPCLGQLLVWPTACMPCLSTYMLRTLSSLSWQGGDVRRLGCATCRLPARSVSDVALLAAARCWHLSCPDFWGLACSASSRRFARFLP